jgi:hypothetical protein
MINSTKHVFLWMILSISMILTALPSLSYAQDAPPSFDMGQLVPGNPNPNEKVVERTYAQVTYEGLYKLAWSYGAFDIQNIEHLNTYLKVTECNLYLKFYQNEFEWEKIKAATRKFLTEHKLEVPRYYEYVQPLILGRYDYSLQGFPVKNSDNYKGQRNLQFARFMSGQTSCGPMSINEYEYPATAILSIDSPFTITFVRVSPDLAQQYVEWRIKNGLSIGDERQAFIRYRIRIDEYLGMKDHESREAFNFKGKLQRIDVFADEELLLPLYNQFF